MLHYSTIISEQKQICNDYSAEYQEAPIDLKFGISKEGMIGTYPLHGLRHPPEGYTSGWYIWSGEFSEEVDFFEPLCIHHFDSYPLEILKYLGLAPGWRFLLAPNYVDVWYDKALLNV